MIYKMVFAYLVTLYTHTTLTTALVQTMYPLMLPALERYGLVGLYQWAHVKLTF